MKHADQRAFSARGEQSAYIAQRQINSLVGTRFQFEPMGSRRLFSEVLSSQIHQGVRLMDVRLSAHSTRLIPGRPGKGSSEMFLVSLQLEGKSRVTQAGRDCESEPGQIFIIDTSRPFEIETLDMRSRSVYLDASFMRSGFPEHEHFTATTFDSRSGAGAVCGNLISYMFSSSEMASPILASKMGESLSSLLALALFDSESDSNPDGRFSRNSEMLAKVRRYIKMRLRDSSLDCATISSESGISLRRLHQLFSEEGTTVMKWVWQERLRHIAKDLKNPALAHRSTSMIAYDWGFSEPAHFSRSFKRAFGMTPMNFRQSTREGVLKN